MAYSLDTVDTDYATDWIPAYLGIACGDGHGKSPMGICGTTNRRGLLRSLKAKVELVSDYLRRYDFV